MKEEVRGFFICIFHKTYVNRWLCYGSARLRLLISESVFELASSRRDRHSFGIARFIFSWKGRYLYIYKPFTDHTDQTCSYIRPKTWPIFRFTLGEYDGYLISSFASCQVIDDPGGGGGSPRKSVVQSACQYIMTSRLASVTFNVASKVFIEETNKNFVLITEILFRFLGFRDFKIPVVIENQTLVLFWNETSWLV